MSEPAPNIPVMSWDAWPKHPDWATERQHKDKGLIPGGEPVAQVWYGNKYMKRRGEDGHYIPLYDLTLATPKVVSDEKRAALARANETKIANRTCAFCGKENYWTDIYGEEHVTKIKREPKMCAACYARQQEITEARAWLADPNIIILDTETTDLYGEILQMGLLSISGETLLDSLIKPTQPIDEALYHIIETDWGEEREKPTAFAIHGIGNEMVKDAPAFPEVWERASQIISGKKLLIFNADYDVQCLLGDLQRHNLESPDIYDNNECVMRWYAGYHGEWSRKYRDYKFISLDQALSEQEVEIDSPSHDALGDCQRTLALIKKIAAKQAPLDPSTDGRSAKETTYE